MKKYFVHFFQYTEMSLKHLSVYAIMIHKKILHIHCDCFSKFSALLMSDLFCELCMNTFCFSLHCF